jgi:hypothetical protein
MLTGRKLMRHRIARSAIAISLGLGATASAAYAHGGMAGPDELGPPLFTSAALAFVCYWVVILWPSSKREGSDGVPPGRKKASNADQRLARQSRRAAVPGESTQLRKIDSNRGRGKLKAGRKANDV